jgi:hypothetical protein
MYSYDILFSTGVGKLLKNCLYLPVAVAYFVKNVLIFLLVLIITITTVVIVMHKKNYVGKIINKL